jgi:multidrug transporter EmrE-like cation transporter
MLIYLKLISVIVVRTFTDICFKAAVHRLEFGSFSGIGKNLKKMGVNPFLWAGLALGILNVVLWTSSLEDFDLSYAYPFLSISYVTIILSGKFLFHETLDRNKLIGIGFITAGALALFFG